MPKNRKEALEKYFRAKGARTGTEQQELLDKLNWRVGLRKGPVEVLKAPVGGGQIVRRRHEVSVKSELRTMRDHVILDAEFGERREPIPEDDRVDEAAAEGSGGLPPVDPTANEGGEHGA